MVYFRCFGHYSRVKTFIEIYMKTIFNIIKNEVKRQGITFLLGLLTNVISEISRRRSSDLFGSGGNPPQSPNFSNFPTMQNQNQYDI